MKKNEFINKGIWLPLLLLLFASCEREDTNVSSESDVQVIITLGGIRDAEGGVPTRAGITPMAVGTRFRLLVYSAPRSAGVLAAQLEYVVTASGATSAVPLRLPDGTYEFVAYSYNTSTAIPALADGSSTLSLVNGQDFLFHRNNQADKVVVDGQKPVRLTLTFDRLMARVRTRLDASASNAMILSPGVVKVSGLRPSGTFSAQTGALTIAAGSETVVSGFGGIGSCMLTSNPCYVLPVTNADLTFSVDSVVMQGSFPVSKDIPLSVTSLVAGGSYIFTATLGSSEGANVLSGANCYIIPRRGEYVLDASIRGNGVQVVPPTNLASGSVATAVPATVAELNITGGASAEVLWETTNRTTAPTVGSVVKDVSYDAATKQISFTTTGHEGNALIALKDASGTILWSWHIWRTNEPPVSVPLAAITATDGTVLATEGELKLMDRNVGALSAAPQSDLSTGLLYQWGRKDPFAGAATLSTTITSMAFNRVNNGSGIEWPAALLAAGGSAITPVIAVKTPTTYYTVSSDWCARNDNLWGTPITELVQSFNKNKGSKTIYDPCPVGWYVGPQYTFMNVAKGSLTFAKGYLFPIGTGAVSIWFPAAGIRNRNSVRGVLVNVGVGGYYWSSSASSLNASGGAAMTLNSGGSIVSSQYGHRADGYEVRCVME